MVNNIDRMGTQAALKMFGDWTDRVAAGELPASKPTRPQGIERNAVVTVWDWSNPKAYLHDATVSDKRNPTVNANGLDLRRDRELDRHGAGVRSGEEHRLRGEAARCAIRRRRRKPKCRCSRRRPISATRRSGTRRPARTACTTTDKGRVMFTARIRPAANPDFCKKGSDHPSAKVFPLDTSGRQLRCMIRRPQKYTLINTCFPTHHVQFGFDKDNTAWVSAGGPQSGVAGWVNMRMLEETGDEQKAQGWTPFILDTNGDGKRGEYTEPNQPFDPNKDRRINVAFYGASPAHDGTVWGSSLGYPGYVVRLDPTKRDPSSTALAEDLRGPGPGLWPARLRHRLQGHRLGAAVERPHGDLRPQQVQGPQRADHPRRQALPRGLDALSVPGSEAHRRSGHRLGGSELLHLGRPARHPGPRQGHAASPPATRTSR